MARKRSRTVWLGKVSSQDRRPAQLALMHEHFPEALRRALDPTRSVTYYREWRLSEPHWNGNSVWGQLGFVRRTRHEEVDYDESTHEWISTEAPARQGNFANFVIDLETQFVGFEERGDDLRRDSFLRALGKFLEAADLEVNLISDTRGFDVWLDQVDLVTRFNVTLRPPNPGYSKRATEVRKLATEIDAERLMISAESDTGLKVRDTLLDGAAETAARGNGSFKVTGVVGGRRRFFDSARRAVQGLIEVSDEDSSSTISAKISDLMAEIAPEPPEDPSSND